LDADRTPGHVPGVCGGGVGSSGGGARCGARYRSRERTQSHADVPLRPEICPGGWYLIIAPSPVRPLSIRPAPRARGRMRPPLFLLNGLALHHLSASERRVADQMLYGFGQDLELANSSCRSVTRVFIQRPRKSTVLVAEELGFDQRRRNG